MKNKKLRLIWLIPNVFCYLMLIGFSIFVFRHAEELRGINRLSIWVLMLLGLFFVSLFGSFRIRQWIMDGKM